MRKSDCFSHTECRHDEISDEIKYQKIKLVHNWILKLHFYEWISLQKSEFDAELVLTYDSWKTFENYGMEISCMEVGTITPYNMEIHHYQP